MAMKTEEDKESTRPDAPRKLFRADLPPGELDQILRRIEENLAFRQILAGQGAASYEGKYVLPQVPPVTQIDSRLDYIRALQAPLFGPVKGFLLSFISYVLNLPIRLFGRKQRIFNEELLALLYDLASLLQVLSEHSLILSSWGNDIERMQDTLQQIQDTQLELVAHRERLEGRPSTSRPDHGRMT